ncbi:hypothetical protein KFU94_64085 [Chloroflexi bacterium TSY]|nr:hypothetical protein [Chloroflexi bacterium TSY]
MDLLRLYTEELLRGKEASMGKALVAAKERYFKENMGSFSATDKVMMPFHEKSLQELGWFILAG